MVGIVLPYLRKYPTASEEMKIPATARVMLECCIFGLQLLQVFLQWERIENNLLRHEVDVTL